jgi:hypothetical protein
MAQVKSNMILQGISGKLVPFVFRQRGKKTYLAMAPAPRRSRPTAVEQTIRTNFSKAIRYAQQAMAIGELKAIYQAGAPAGLSAFNMAVKDFSHAPEIHEVDTSRYNASRRSTITINATDNFKVKKVEVIIKRPNDSVIEYGNAVRQRKSNYWIYTLQRET